MLRAQKSVLSARTSAFGGPSAALRTVFGGLRVPLQKVSADPYFYRTTGYIKSPPNGQGRKPSIEARARRAPSRASQSKLPWRKAPLFPRLRLPTHADPASDPGIDETAAFCSVDLYHARPRSLDGSIARPDKAGASGVFTCSHSPSLIFTTPRVDRGE